MKTQIEKNQKTINDVIREKEGKKQGGGVFVFLLVVVLAVLYFLFN